MFNDVPERTYREAKPGELTVKLPWENGGGYSLCTPFYKDVYDKFKRAVNEARKQQYATSLGKLRQLGHLEVKDEKHG